MSQYLLTYYTLFWRSMYTLSNCI